MPQKFRLGRHYKNGERKKRAAKAQAAASPVSETLVISLPLRLFTETAVSSPDILERRLNATGAITSGKYVFKHNMYIHVYTVCLPDVIVSSCFQDGL